MNYARYLGPRLDLDPATHQDHHHFNITVVLEIMQVIPILSPLSDFITLECEIPGSKHDDPRTKRPLRAFDKFIPPTFLWLHLESALWFSYVLRLWEVDSQLVRTVLVLLSLVLFVLPWFFRGWITSVNRLKSATTVALLHQILLLAVSFPFFIWELVYELRCWEATRFLCCVALLVVAVATGAVRMLRWCKFVGNEREKRLPSTADAQSALERDG
jgi:hypothetical protein